MSAASWMSTAQVGKRFGVGERRVLKLNRHGVLSSLSFTNNKGVCYFDQTWLGKATNIFQKKQGNINQSKKRPATAGLFFY